MQMSFLLPVVENFAKLIPLFPSHLDCRSKYVNEMGTRKRVEGRWPLSGLTLSVMIALFFIRTFIWFPYFARDSLWVLSALHQQTSLFNISSVDLQGFTCTDQLALGPSLLSTVPLLDTRLFLVSTYKRGSTSNAIWNTHYIFGDPARAPADQNDETLSSKI